jgi:hypothetical protein
MIPTTRHSCARFSCKRSLPLIRPKRSAVSLQVLPESATVAPSAGPQYRHLCGNSHRMKIDGDDNRLGCKNGVESRSSSLSEGL